MITEERFTRNNKGYIALKGIEEGKAPNAIIPDSVHDRTQQPYELVLGGISISCDIHQKGQPVSMVATWAQVHYDNAGNVIASYTHKEPHTLTPEEVQEFTQGFLPMLQPSIYNGAIRGGKSEHGILLGHNTQPLFDATGQRIADESYDTSQAPDYGYGG
jgi:hypothetical protein